MAVCPSCHTEQKRRINGRCPNCKAKIDSYDGYWYPTGTGNPNLALVNLFEDLISEKLTYQQGTNVVFRIPPKSARYRRELVAAGRLLELTNYDINLAKDALQMLFTDKQFNWKNLSTLLYLGNDFTMAVALVRARQTKQQEARAKEDKYIQKLAEEEDIFS